MEETATARRAPYAPVGALHGFLSSIRRGNPPARIDVAYLRSHALARGNEWAFISALKFLGVVDHRGHPTPIFRRLQGSQDTGRETLANLVLAAYQPLFDGGGADMTSSQLRAWFARNSSASQAGNAVRFFREVCRVAGIELAASSDEGRPQRSHSAKGRTALSMSTAATLRSRGTRPVGAGANTDGRGLLLQKIPSYDAWTGTAEEYLRVLEIFETLTKPT